MPVPKLDAFIQPLLDLAADGDSHTLREAEEYLAREFRLARRERNELTAGGAQTRLRSRMNWANTSLKRAGLLESAGRGQFRITDEGRRVLASASGPIDKKYLLRYPSFAAFSRPALKSARSQIGRRPLPIWDEEDLQMLQERQSGGALYSPRQQLRQVLQMVLTRMRSQFDDDLLLRLTGALPEVFERTVLELLLALNFGQLEGERERIVVQQRNEQGFAGVIQSRAAGDPAPGFLALCLDPLLLLDWRALHASGLKVPGQDGCKGILISSARFAGDILTASGPGGDHDLQLLDGKQLAALMIEHGLGVQAEQHFSTYALDADYFEPN
ncbi:MAG: hypothetical protein OXF32_10465 [Anaerolineaceae bacterium]|nr:hypothetical protein [Anaerolineaceae bacterium]